MRDVFLSHASLDNAQARQLRDLLVAHGVPVWFSPHHIKGAELWQDEIGEALARCNWFIVILSPHSIKSKWVKRELQYALDESRYDNRIKPISYKPCNYKDLSWTLGASQFVDFTTGFDEGCRNLLRVWGLGYRGESTKKPSRRG